MIEVTLSCVVIVADYLCQNEKLRLNFIFILRFIPWINHILRTVALIVFIRSRITHAKIWLPIAKLLLETVYRKRCYTLRELINWILLQIHWKVLLKLLLSKICTCVVVNMPIRRDYCRAFWFDTIGIELIPSYRTLVSVTSGQYLFSVTCWRNIKWHS